MLTKKMNDDGTFSIPELEEWRLENSGRGSGRKSKIVKFRFSETEEGCWRCVSHTSRRKSGSLSEEEGCVRMQFYFPDGTRGTIVTNKVLMELSGAKRYDDMGMMLHRCDHPWCCNPTHLYLGDDKDNMKDRLARNRASFNHRREYMSVAKIMFIRDHSELSHETLAKTLGCSFTTIGQIRRGEVYTHFAYEPRRDGQKRKTKRVDLPPGYLFGESKASSWNNKLNKGGPKQGTKKKKTS